MRNRLLSSLVFIVTGVACGDSEPDGSGVEDAAVTIDGAVTDASPDANPNAPTCVITGPANGASTGFDVPVRLAATAMDPEDGVLTGASVVWRTSLQVAPLGSGDVVMTTLPAGSNVVTCTATDSNNNTGTATVTILSKTPYAKINHPGDNETRAANQAVPFTGIGRDVEDGTLSGGSLVWTSSLDGSLGTGQMFNRVLSVGVHTITLTITDSALNVDTNSITLTIQ